MPRTILVVDDSSINRRILKKILEKDYTVLEAESGTEAMAVLHREHQRISALLLDIVMPVMDGYAVLKAMSADPALSLIPVIVTTGSTDEETEERVLTLGATDFVGKPFASNVIKRRIANLIKLRETSAMVNTLQRDSLTGLWNRETFFEKAQEEISRQPEGSYFLSCLDIDNFKVINDQYGTEAGDKALQSLAKLLDSDCVALGGLCGRISADDFITLFPRQAMEIMDKKLHARRFADLPGTNHPVTISIGRYIVNDKSLSLSAMYDRAKIAQNMVKGRYDVPMAVYDESMRRRLLREQEITNEMHTALQEGQFEPWYQPQYNHASGALIGAEALARWRHPRWGLVSPGEFIPVFERNGFVYELDRSIWEQVCAQLRLWLDSGLAPLPVSVNISRRDLFREDLADEILALIKKYDLSPELLRLEVTESAFAQSAAQVVNVVKELIALGFTVEIDDFGSGYSSLNTLKDVPAQILKLDMRFLAAGDDDRGGSILESIVRMSKWLGMSVIAEGVEKVTQADYLKSIGCSYIQGFLYAKPMPAPDYENLFRDARGEPRLTAMQTVKNLNNSSFWNPESMDTLIFNSYVGAACIFEYTNGKIELIRATDKCAQVLDSTGVTVDKILKLNLNDYLDEENLRLVDRAVKQSMEGLDEVTEEFVFLNLPSHPGKTCLRTTLRVIASAGDSCLVYCTNENLTAQRVAEEEKRVAAERMQAIMQNINGGVSAVTADASGRHSFVFANDRYYALYGYTREEFLLELPNPATSIHPEDREQVFASIKDLTENGGSSSNRYRIFNRDGQIVTLRAFSTAIRLEGIDGPVILTISTDISDVAAAEQKQLDTDAQLQAVMDSITGGVSITPIGEENVGLTYANDRYYALFGYTRQQFAQELPRGLADLLVENFREGVKENLRLAILQDKPYSMEFQVRKRDGSIIWVRCVGSKRLIKGNPVLISVTYDITEEKQNLSLKDTIPFVLSAIMDSSPDMAFAKDKDFNFICCSPGFVKFARQKSEADVIGKNDYDLWTKEEADHFRADDRLLFEKGESMVDFIEPIPSDDDYQHYSVTSKYVLRDSDGNIVGLYGVGRDVTDTRADSQRLRLLTDSIPGGLVTYAVSPTDISITYYNDGFCKMLGCTREEYPQYAKEGATSRVFPEDHPRLMEQIRNLYENGTPLDCTYRNYRVDRKSYVWINIKGTIAQWHDETVFVNAVLLDVTSQKQAEEKTRSAEEKLQAIINNVDGGVAALTIAEGKLSYIFANERYSGIFGYTPQQFHDELPNGMADIMHPDDVENVGRVAAENQEACGTATVEYRVRCRNGEPKWVRASGSICRLEGVETPVHVVVLYDISREKSMLEKLRESEEQFRIACDMSGAIIGRYDIRTRQYHHNDKTMLALGLPTVIPNALQTFVDSGFVMQESIQDVLDFYAAVERGETPCRGEAKLMLADGAGHWCRLDARVTFDEGGQPSHAVIVTNDITDEREREAVYKRWQQSIEDKPLQDYTLFRWNLSSDSPIDTYDGRLLEMKPDPTLLKTFNANMADYAADHVSHQDLKAYLAFLNSDSLLAAYHRGVRTNTLEYREKLDGDAERWLRLTVELVEYPNSTDVCAYLLCENIDEKKREELHIREQAELDPLTGVLNRSTFAAKMNAIISKTPCALLFIDIDGFKLLNDTFGHGAGDQALIEMAASLSAILRPNDLLGRLGGDEFLVALGDIADIGDISAKAGQICTLMRKTYSSQVKTTVSIGISVSPGDGNDFDTLCHKADTALYAVKESGKDNFAFFDSGMSRQESAAQGKALTATPEKPAKTRRRMLIVDDNEINAEVLEFIFKNDFIVDKVKSGAAALMRLRHFGSAISVVLLDLLMPEMDGFAVLEKMRESDRMKTIPVIVVSGVTDEETALRVISYGASDFVSKPVNPNVIQVRVASAISKAENEKLRAQNSLLTMQNMEVERYRAVLDSNHTVSVENDWNLGTFTYDPMITKYLAGCYDNRSLWRILLSDFVADAMDVRDMQTLAHGLTTARGRVEGAMEVKLKTPGGKKHSFRFAVIKIPNEFQLTDKLIYTFTDLEYSND